MMALNRHLRSIKNQHQDGDNSTDETNSIINSSIKLGELQNEDTFNVRIIKKKTRDYYFYFCFRLKFF